MNRTLLVSLLLCASTVPAVAQVPATDVDEKSRSSALMMSVAGTAASGALLVAGVATESLPIFGAGAGTLIVTPALGHIYTGHYFTAGMALRAAGEGMVVLFSSDDIASDDAAPLVLVGAVAIVAGTIADIASTPRAVRRYNAKHAMAVAPMIARDPRGGAVGGVALGGSF